MVSNDREYARSASLPDWMKDFADHELKKEGNPFDDIRDVFRQKNDVIAFEDKVQELCERIGLGQIEKQAKKKDDIFGGLADGQPDKRYDKEQLEKGIKVELEHTDDPARAKEITKDHLEESEDFKGGDGAEYYDELEDMEKRIEEKLTKKQSLLANLIKTANKLEDSGDIESAKMIDKLIYSMAKKEEEEEESDVFEKHPELQQMINGVCAARAGFIDAPALMHKVQTEFLDIKLNDKDKKHLKKYIAKQIEMHKQPVKERNMPEHGYVVFVVTEDDGNNNIFDVPSRM